MNRWAILISSLRDGRRVQHQGTKTQRKRALVSSCLGGRLDGDGRCRGAPPVLPLFWGAAEMAKTKNATPEQIAREHITEAERMQPVGQVEGRDLPQLAGNGGGRCRGAPPVLPLFWGAAEMAKTRDATPERIAGQFMEYVDKIGELMSR